jgi:hypothetical protein
LFLRSILDPFGCSIIQWDGRWNIVRVEEKIAAYDYRDFDFNGDYIGNGTYNPVKTLKVPSIASDVKFFNVDQNLNYAQATDKFKASYHLGLKPNILQNGDFRLKKTPLNNPLFPTRTKSKSIRIIGRLSMLVIRSTKHIKRSLKITLLTSSRVMTSYTALTPEKPT